MVQQTSSASSNGSAIATKNFRVMIVRSGERRQRQLAQCKAGALTGS
jgi:hypothetical protein